MGLLKAAINAWTVDEHTSFEDMFRQVKEAGFDGIELNVDNAGGSAHSLTLDMTDEDLAKIKVLSETYGLPVISISTSLYGGGVMLGSNNCEERTFGKKLLEKQLYFANALGAKGILIVPGGISESTSIKDAYRNSLEAIIGCKSVIEDYKIKVGVENVWNSFFVSPFDMNNFIDSLDSEYIAAYYDVGNTVAFSWTEYWIDALADRIAFIHVKDFLRNGGINSGGEFVDLCKGSVNWKKAVDALRNVGYEGYLTAEVFKNDEKQSFTDYYKEVADALKSIIAL